jgi:hypothetical protein
LIEHTRESIGVDLQQFEEGQHQSRRRRRGQSRRRSRAASLEPIVNVLQCALTVMNHDVFGETNRLSIPTSQSELICNRSKGSALTDDEEKLEKEK